MEAQEIFGRDRSSHNQIAFGAELINCAANQSNAAISHNNRRTEMSPVILF